VTVIDYAMPSTRRPGPFSRLAVYALVGLALTGWAARAEAQAQARFKIVVNAGSSVGSFTAAEVSRFFLKKTVRWSSGEPVHAVDLPETSPIRANFSQAIHDRPVAAIKVYWQQQIFAGQGVPPVELASEREVLDYVAATVGAIGYVSADAPVREGVKVVPLRDS
jgi:ABC-type phosphate transport system substrate-binding protein